MNPNTIVDKSNYFGERFGGKIRSLFMKFWKIYVGIFFIVFFGSITFIYAMGRGMNKTKKNIWGI